MGFRLAYLHLTVAYSKGRLGRRKGVSPSLLAFFSLVLCIVRKKLPTNFQANLQSFIFNFKVKLWKFHSLPLFGLTLKWKVKDWWFCGRSKDWKVNVGILWNDAPWSSRLLYASFNNKSIVWLPHVVDIALQYQFSAINWQKNSFVNTYLYLYV